MNQTKYKSKKKKKKSIPTIELIRQRNGGSGSGSQQLSHRKGKIVLVSDMISQGRLEDAFFPKPDNFVVLLGPNKRVLFTGLKNPEIKDCDYWRPPMRQVVYI